MTSLLGTSLGVFIGLTGIGFGFAAFLAGQAVASKWLPAMTLLPAAIGLALGARFLTFALFEGALLSPLGTIVQFLYLWAVAFVAWRLTLAYKMVHQYPWLYERSGLFGWREKA
ncbi:MAG: hypothetical protein JNL66_26350 [Alphaproteobacteria bacterium]|nr:hypothetical protein [Alphaproteobacteria bacterium]